MRVLRARRLYNIALFMLVVGSTYLALQWFSFKMISTDLPFNASATAKALLNKLHHLQRADIATEAPARRRSRLKPSTKETPSPKVNKLPIIKKREPDNVVVKNNQVIAPNKLNPEVEKIILEPAEHHQHKVGQDRIDRIRGVSPLFEKFYVPNEKNMFECINSHEFIPFSRINDDFCDCADSSDEPGTSACSSQSRFFCDFQVDVNDLMSILSSRVNDGVCDCCDGSDEWKHVIMSAHDRLNKSAPYHGKYVSPCSDHCKEERMQLQYAAVVGEQGRLLKQQYIQEGQGHLDLLQLYGEDGAFYKLSKKCFEAKSDKYDYTVCPFSEVLQRDGNLPAVVLGRSASWVKQGKAKGYVLQMSGGDSSRCPDSRSRMTLITFSCSIEDRVVSIREQEVCIYEVKFITPAAC